MTRLDFVSEGATLLKAPSSTLVDECIASLVSNVLSLNPEKDGAERLRETLQPEVDVLEAALLAVGNRILARTAALKRRMNDTLPIHRLPPELFAAIIQADLKDDIHFGLNGFKKRSRLWQLARVSSHWWKTITLGTIFWADIRYGRDDVNLCLRKSQNALLNIFFIHNHREGGLEFFRAVTTASYRWKSAYISLTPQLMRDLTNALAEPMPELNDVAIVFRAVPDPFMDQPVIQLPSLPKLQHLCLTNVGLDTGSFKPERLISLRLRVMESPTLNLSWLTTVLRSSPNLEQLALLNIQLAVDEVLPLKYAVALPRLKDLELGLITSDVLQFLLSSIEASQIQALTLRGLDSDSGFLNDTNCSSRNKLIQHLSSIIPSVSEMKIIFDYSTSHIWVVSIQPSTGSEWALWAETPHAAGLSLKAAAQSPAQAMEAMVLLLNEAGLEEGSAGTLHIEIDGPPIQSFQSGQGCLTVATLSKLPITTLSVSGDVDIKDVLRYLGSPHQTSSGTWGYLCPRLEMLGISNATEAVVPEDVDVFLAQRYGDGQPFFIGTQLVARPPRLLDFFLPPHLDFGMDEGSEDGD